jgi:hypothetical protein
LRAFVKTLNAIEEVTKSGKLDPIVRYAVAREVAWLADHGPGETKKVAKRIRNGLPKSLDFRILCALIDGYGLELRELNPENHLQYQERRLDALIDEILKDCTDGEALRVHIARHIDHIEASDLEKAGSSFILCNKLAFRSVGFDRAIVDDACSEAPSSVAAHYIPSLIDRRKRKTRSCCPFSYPFAVSNSGVLRTICASQILYS